MPEHEQLSALWNGAGRFDLIEQPRPTPEPHEAVLEVEASGICGSDLYIYGIRHILATPFYPQRCPEPVEGTSGKLERYHRALKRGVN